MSETIILVMNFNENLILKIIIQVLTFISIAATLLCSLIYIDDYSRPIKGVVSTYPYPFTIRAQRDAQISRLAISEGEAVVYGQELLLLNKEPLVIELEKLKNSYNNLQKKLIFEEEKIDILLSRLELNKQHSKTIADRFEIKKKHIKNKKKLVAKTQHYSDSINNNAKGLITQLDNNKTEYISKVSELDIRAKAQNVIESNSSMAKEKAQIMHEDDLVYLEFQQGTYELKTTNRNIEYEINQARQEVLALNSTIEAIDSEIQKLNVSIKHAKIVAPLDGIVVTIGSNVLASDSVANNDTLVTLVPKNSSLLGILELSDEQYRQIKIGQRVNLEFFAWNHYKYGVLKGEVKNISVGKKIHPITKRYSHFAEVSVEDNSNVEVGYSFKAKILWEKIVLYKYILKKLNVDKNEKKI